MSEHKHEWDIRAVAIVEDPDENSWVFVLYKCENCTKTTWERGHLY